MNAYRAYKRGDEILKPHHWLIKIAHNVARTRYARASRRIKEVPLEDHVEQLAVPEDERPDIEAVLRALGRLPFNQRAALVMRELEGRSYGEIADTLDVSVPAVETLIFRARRSLKMRASALRSLAAVPLPGSLSQLFGSGGIVAGGGAAAGSGFLVKAAVALLAGAVATGIGSDRTRPAEAAKSAAPQVEASGSSVAQARMPHQPTAAMVATRPATAPKRTHHRTRGAQDGDSVMFSAARKRPQASTPAPSAAPATAVEKTTTVASLTQPVNDAVESVTDTVDGVVESLPVEVPPIELPPVPLPVPAPPPIKLP